MSLFQPELFRITGIHNVHVQKRSLGDPEDPYDENYLRETSVSVHSFYKQVYLFEALYKIFLLSILYIKRKRFPICQLYKIKTNVKNVFLIIYIHTHTQGVLF